MEPVIALDRGPECVTRQTVVDAPAGEIFALLANPHRHHEIDGSGSVRPDVIGPRALHLGDKFRTSMRMFNVPYAITNTVTALEPDCLIEWEHFFGHRWRWELEDLGDGRTRVTESFNYAPATFPPLINAIKAPERNATGIEQSLRRMQEHFARG